jgi:carbon starvation protein
MNGLASVVPVVWTRLPVVVEIGGPASATIKTGGNQRMTAMPVMIVILCLMAIAYRFYSAFLAARVATLDDSRITPANEFNDGQNFHPTNKWVLFGHHFAAISGAGPLIGPVLAAQFGYLPGLLWIVIGVCLAGAVQDFLVLAASIRRGGRSLAQIALSDLGKTAGTAATFAILFIIIIALAGLGKVVVKALGGEEVVYPAGSRLVLPKQDITQDYIDDTYEKYDHWFRIPAGSTLTWNDGKSSMKLNESFHLSLEKAEVKTLEVLPDRTVILPKGAFRVVPGSSWGTFTIACTIPIALFVGLYMYKLRPGRVLEASIIGAALTLFATFVGGVIPGSRFEDLFNLSAHGITFSMAVYGFVASVLPVWVLLCPRDYLSSFLKIGTIILLVGGVMIANPKLEAPAINHTFLSGGPTVPGSIFPFLFITIMCGAISGFHALVSSGTTPKMIKTESHARQIGYGAMLIEGLVGVTAMIAAATLPVGDYYAMNTDLAKVPQFQDKFVQIGADIDHLNVYEDRTQEALRGRTGGAVTLAVGMAHIFDGVAQKISSATEQTLATMWKYWYHFAIMFEALFILTTIDTGTRIGRFLLQEMMGTYIHPKLGETSWWPGAIGSTLLIVAGWSYFISANSMDAIWPMFGIANQMLAVIALAIVSGYLVNEGKAKYLWVTITPMVVVFTTTSSGAVSKLIGKYQAISTQLALENGKRNWTTIVNASVETALILAMLLCTIIIIAQAGVRIWMKTRAVESRLAVRE